MTDEEILYRKEQWHNMLYRLHLKYPMLNIYYDNTFGIKRMLGEKIEFDPKKHIGGLYLKDENVPWEHNDDCKVFCMPSYQNGSEYVSSSYGVCTGYTYTYRGVLKFKEFPREYTKTLDSFSEEIAKKEQDIEEFMQMYLNAVNQKKQLEAKNKIKKLKQDFE